MKQLLSQPLAHVGQRRPRITWLAVLPLAMSLLFAFIPIASPAFASPNSHTTSNLAATKPASSLRLAQIVHLSATSTVLTSSRNSAGDPCKTISTYYPKNDNGITIFWLKMVTTWCYNYVTVTSHSTTLYWGVTTTGTLTGWYSLYNPIYSFACYVASGSSRNCSGNHERAQEDFINGILRLEIDLVINQEETYQGQAFYQLSQIKCPGGC